jgi:quercetin dioxygenase-like cupin family protein
MTVMSTTHTFLLDLIAATEIPAEGTLSKVVFKDDQIRVVLFAFDKGQELTEHTAALPAVVQVLAGHLRLTMGSEIFDAKPGDWAHMPAKLPHSVEAIEPSVMLLTLLPAPIDQVFPRAGRGDGDST